MYFREKHSGLKFISEYRDSEAIRQLLWEISATCTGEWKIMEVCGGQTHSLAKNGLLQLLPHSITMVHGPGCPVCVTPASMIDKAIDLAMNHSVTLCTYGDMMRVPGTGSSLLQAKALGADVRITYSPLDALKLAEEFPQREVVFFAVGFETTAPANALAVVEAERKGVYNFSILTAQVLVPPAMEAILEDIETAIDAFLAPGHVCTVMGTEEYEQIVGKYYIPIIVTGFEPVDLLQGILMAVRQLESGDARLELQYSRMVQPQGNQISKKLLDKVFEPGDRDWRGIGLLPQSGYHLRPEWKSWDAAEKFASVRNNTTEITQCLSGEVMKGKIKPPQCPLFGKECTPEHPVGAPMVSTEGACSAYYLYQRQGS